MNSPVFALTLEGNRPHFYCQTHLPKLLPVRPDRPSFVRRPDMPVPVAGVEIGLGRYNYNNIVGIGFTSEPCETCKVEAANRANVEEFKALLQSPEFAYTRFKYDNVWIYCRDPESPTGVRQKGGGVSMAEFEAIQAELRASGTPAGNISPLSPTERR